MVILPFLPCFSWFEKVLFIQLAWIFMPFDLRLAANRTAFSTILPCVLHQNAVYFAPKRSVFCTKTHYVLVHIALYLAVNGS